MIPLQDMLTYASCRHWTLTGPEAVVKAVSVQDAPRPASTGQARGYVTQAKFLKNLNALQIESALGLRPNSMKKGCYIFYFARLPKLEDVDQRFFADMPEGKPWSDKKHGEYLAAVDARRTSGSDLVDYYPPGSGKVRQWALLKPVPLSQHWRLVTPSMPFEI